MKQLIKLLRKKIVVLIILLGVVIPANSAFAEEITMICTYTEYSKTFTRILKYVNPIIRRKQIYTRVDGQWEEWCDKSDPEDHKPCELKISDRGAVMDAWHLNTTIRDVPQYGLSKGDQIVQVTKYTLDFQFFKRRVDISWKTLSGKNILKNDERSEEWSCKKHDSSDE